MRPAKMRRTFVLLAVVLLLAAACYAPPGPVSPGVNAPMTLEASSNGDWESMAVDLAAAQEIVEEIQYALQEDGTLQFRFSLSDESAATDDQLALAAVVSEIMSDELAVRVPGVPTPTPGPQPGCDVDPQGHVICTVDVAAMVAATMADERAVRVPGSPTPTTGPEPNCHLNPLGHVVCDVQMAVEADVTTFVQDATEGVVDCLSDPRKCQSVFQPLATTEYSDLDGQVEIYEVIIDAPGNDEKAVLLVEPESDLIDAQGRNIGAAELAKIILEHDINATVVPGTPVPNPVPCPSPLGKVVCAVAPDSVEPFMRTVEDAVSSLRP